MRRRLLLVGLVLLGCDSAAVPDDAAGTDARGLDAPGLDAPGADGPGLDAPGSDAPAGDAGDPPGTWRSALFPGDWAPVHEGGAVDAEGRFLPDFSYAGWHRGEARPPIGADHGMHVMVDDTIADGVVDTTSTIQDAIDDVCAAGGGVVELGEGTYRIRLPMDGATTALRISCSDFVLRGQGPDRTHVLFDDPLRARSVAVIAVRGPGSIYDNAGTATIALDADLGDETRVVTLASDPTYTVGQWIVVRNETTDAFRAEHRMDAATSGLADLWPSSGIRGLMYVRRIEAIAGRALTLDTPIRYPLRTRDLSRTYAAPALISEVGLESFSIGMTESPTSATRPDADHDDDYTVTGTAGYEVHASRAIELDRVHDAWIADVDSYTPPGNAGGYDVLSNGIVLSTGSTHVTVLDCDWGRTQYRGGGGNGYLFQLLGSDHILRGGSATEARHGYIINYAASGNVFRDVRIVRSRFSDDSHRFLAHANLYDRVVLESAWIQAVNRGTTSTGAGFTATQHVFWGTRVEVGHPTADDCAVESAQWGWGYLIGSSAAAGEMALLCPTSFTNGGWAALDQGAPEDWVEGEGLGATLFPGSLHQMQLDLRCARDGLPCSW